VNPAYSSAEAFLASTTRPQPECLVLDIHPGGKSDLDLQRRLHEVGDPAPIIFVTTHDGPGDREEAERGGCMTLRARDNIYRMSEVKGPVMGRLKRSHFLEELTGKVHLTQFDAVSSINPNLARRTLEAQRPPQAAL
jgi:CheY-like chemotaxis protein